MSFTAEMPTERAQAGDWFESLMCEMSARFINLPPNQMDAALERAQRLLCEGFGLDRSTLWQKSPGASTEMMLTHVYQPAEFPEFTETPREELLSDARWILNSAETPPVYRRMDGRSLFPWIFEKIQSGRTVVIDRLDDLPPEAALDREILRQYQTKSTVVVPLWTGEDWLGSLSFGSTLAERSWSPETVKRFELVGHLFTHALARKSSDIALQHNEALLEAILNTAAEGIITIDPRGVIQSANLMAERIFGYAQGELEGRNVSVLMPEPYRMEHDCYLRKYLETGNAKIIGVGRELVGQHKDGTTFPIELSIGETKLGNNRVFTGFVRDISERKKAEESLRESETRFRIIADSAPVLIWMTDAENKLFFVNKRWLDFTGRSIEQESGKGWTSGIHPEDLQEFMENVERGFERRQPFVAQCRLRRRDEAYRWMTNSGVPRFDAKNLFCGFIGSFVDMTERIEAERAAQDLSGRLIHAQEEERARLARELHDDVTQRLARLAIDVGRVERSPCLDTAAGDLIQGVREGLARLSQDVHALSYQLHPSAVIDLGLVDALTAECDEFSRRESVVTHVSLRQLPLAIPSDMAIALFRIAQESLRNAARHGRASKVEVSLWGVDGGVQLVIEDNGVGFDTTLRRNRRGLGLASMRERSRLLGGTCSVDSKPGGGTMVVIWVPLTEGIL
ncbi:MAG TPA: PAS domain S-box protein [Phycisphaerae bacterium]|nr:PAS domain S-box protein [Phycisphaerae bacterium]